MAGISAPHHEVLRVVSDHYDDAEAATIQATLEDVHRRRMARAIFWGRRAAGETVDAALRVAAHEVGRSFSWARALIYS